MDDLFTVNTCFITLSLCFLQVDVVRAESGLLLLGIMLNFLSSVDVLDLNELFLSPLSVSKRKIGALHHQVIERRTPAHHFGGEASEEGVLVSLCLLLRRDEPLLYWIHECAEKQCCEHDQGKSR